MVNRRFCLVAFVLVLGLSVLGSRDFGLFSKAKRSFAADVNANHTGADIAKQEAAIAKEALKLITQLEMNGQASPGSHEVRIWSRRLVEATRKSGATKPEVIEVVKQHLARMEQRAGLLKKLYESRAASQMDVLNAQYEALEAKVWLEEEQAK